MDCLYLVLGEIKKLTYWGNKHNRLLLSIAIAYQFMGK